jgi:hypothetical protein
MPRTVAALAGIAAIVGGLAALSTTSTGASASPRHAQKDAERRTEQRTERFLRAFE